MRREPLLHPAFLAALCVLWLNDHVWKAAHPGALTGKLSDFAGLFMLPIVVDALVRRLGARSMGPARLLTIGGGLWFALANVWPSAQLAFEHAFGLVRWLVVLPAVGLQGLPTPPIRPVTLTPDPSDWIALPAAAVGWLLIRRREP